MNNEQREKDFKKAAEEYDDSPDAVQRIIARTGFEIGAEHGYQYALQHPNWIPVEKEKPQERGHYLVYSQFGEVWLSEWMQDKKGRWDWYVAPICMGVISMVTHWMPLPTPPQRKEAKNE